MRTIGRRLMLVAVLVAVTGCSSAAPAPASTPATRVLTAPAPTPIVEVLTTPSRSAGEAAGRLPAVVAQVTTAAEIVDVLPDTSAGRVYVNDKAGALYVFDTQSYQPVASLQAGSGPMTLDAPNGLLFVVRELGGNEVAVVDTAALALKATIEGGECVAVDSGLHRAFVGSPMPSWPAPPGEVQVWDTRTFRRIGTIAQGGMPAYNPLRDEVYISDFSVFIADGKSLAVTGLLTPDIDPEMTRMCRGCWTPGRVLVDPAQDTIVVPLSNPFSQQPYEPRLFSARSREPVSHTATVLDSPRTPLIVLPPDEGRIYAARGDGVVVYQAGTTQELDLGSGLQFDYYLPGSQVILSLLEPRILAFDAHTWEPLGSIPYEPIHRMDPVGQRLYAWAGAQMTVLSFTGSAPQPPEPAEAWPAGQPFEPVQAVYLSPAFARDRTLFVAAGQQLLRSTDGGASWVRLRGGLPTVNTLAQQAQTRLAVSPAYAEDHTLFAGGRLGDRLGLGVWRSTDGGNTWQPAWQGLRHRLVYDLVISPAFAQDHTLFAYCFGGEGGPFLYRSQDGGASWALFAAPPLVTPSAPSQGPLPPPEELLPAPEALTQFKADGKSVLRSTDGGRTWQTVLSRPDSYAHVRAIVPSPRLASDRQVFALYEDLLYRSTDGGDTWQVADDDVLVQYDYRSAFTSLAVGEADGGQLALFLGDFSGAVLRVDPAQVRWEARPRPTPTPTPTATPPPTPTPVPPPPDPIADLTATAESPGSPTCGDTAPLLRATYERWKDRLGCRSGSPEAGRMIIQRSEHGLMIWLKRGELPEFRVLVDPAEGGRWHALSDRWQEGEPDPVLQPPAGLRQPLGRFGSAWREMRLQAVIGWAVDGEQSYDGAWQSFWQPSGGGELLSGPDGQVYVLFFDDSKWASE